MDGKKESSPPHIQLAMWGALLSFGASLALAYIDTPITRECHVFFGWAFLIFFGYLVTVHFVKVSSELELVPGGRAVVFALVLAFTYWIWPTPWIEHSIGSQKARTVVRVNRLTGTTQVMTQYGWRAASKETKTGQELEACLHRCLEQQDDYKEVNEN